MAKYPLSYFVRHGQTDWNVSERFQGQTDVDINSTGWGQADENGRKLAGTLGKAPGFDFVASPLRRTCETMRRVRKEMGLPLDDFHTDARLKEVNFGDWQGYVADEIEARWPGSIERRLADKWNFRPPGANAESYAMLAARVEGWLEELTQETVGVIHGGVIRALFHLVEGVPGDKAASIDTPQDLVLKLEDDRLTWL
ncbi:MAG: histidine phosphatase family protein [Rhizobiales bacterium 65-79]|nr:histidine phosphatase family protein [Hyphomicrobiales bacterium]OJU01982.1 MAG: histidine phosphatase family protein [Rhizobiales bacterium 65-79]